MNAANPRAPTAGAGSSGAGMFVVAPPSRDDLMLIDAELREAYSAATLMEDGRSRRGRKTKHNTATRRWVDTIGFPCIELGERPPEADMAMLKLTALLALRHQSYRQGCLVAASRQGSTVEAADGGRASRAADAADVGAHKSAARAGHGASRQGQQLETHLRTLEDLQPATARDERRRGRIRAADAAEAGGDAAGQGKKARSEASAALVIRYGRYTHYCTL